MDPESLASSTKSAPRKVRFAPKAPPKREQKPVLPKVEKVENDIDGAQAEQLLRKLNETTLKGRPKAERKAGATEVAFGYAGSSSSSLKSYGAPRVFNTGPPSDGRTTELGMEKEYKEPWDYYSYYPVTHPLRRPYSGNPELLDKQEFEEEPESSAHDEYGTNQATELGLLEENLEDNVFFFQLPKIMPAIEQSAKEAIQEPNNNAKPVKSEDSFEKPKPSNLESLPPGYMGKMLVYRSGAIKLKLGDMLYDVSAGLNCVFAQNVVAVNTEEKYCCNMGELSKRAVITPNVNCILDTISDSE